MGKLLTIALVVDNVETYLSNARLAQLAEDTLSIQSDAEVVNPDFAAMKLPFLVVEPVRIPGSQPGDVVFLEWKGQSDYQLIGSLHFPSRMESLNVFNALLSGANLPVSAEGFSLGGNSLPIGLGLFRLNIPDFLPNFPPMVWLIVALFSGYTAYNSRKTGPQIAWAAATWLAAAKFLKTQSKNIKL